MLSRGSDYRNLSIYILGYITRFETKEIRCWIKAHHITTDTTVSESTQWSFMCPKSNCRVWYPRGVVYGWDPGEDDCRKGSSLMCGLFYFLPCHTANCRNPTVSIPLRNHRGCVEFGSALMKKLGELLGKEGQKGKVEMKDMGLSRSIPRSTILTTP